MNVRSDAAVVVEARGLAKTFRDFWRRPRVAAVDGLSLTVRAGEVSGLLGPNGSGKSTTLKMLLGLLFPTRGELKVFGQSPHLSAVKARLGYMPEESYLYRYLTAAEALDFYGRLFDLDAATRRERVDQLIEMAGLRDAAHRRIGEFSKGMARRVELAQALINDPDLIILDEPTSGLDPLGCRQVKDLIRALAGRGKTIILASHLLADVEDVCSRVTILHQGRVQAEGPVDELLQDRRSVRLTLQALPPERLKSVLDAVARETGAVPSVDHPQQTLEDYFLRVIAQAAKSPETDSARLAPYLSPDPET